jgi:hypothetical protein
VNPNKNKAREDDMALEVIGPGFGRTGTNSLKLALEHLGFGPCHHMFEVRDNPEQLPHWERAARGEKMDWDSVFDGYRAQVDWPGARYWRELIAYYPKAKVVLSVRDPGEWYNSVRATILQFLAARGNHPSAYVNALCEMGHETVDIQVFGGRLADRDHAVQVFNKHFADVRAMVPAERLLMFDVRDGWEPLCRFLNVDIPSSAFPKTNSSKQFTEEEWKQE